MKIIYNNKTIFFQGGLENQDSCCFHKQSKESYVDEMFDNIFQIPKQSEKENNKGKII